MYWGILTNQADNDNGATESLNVTDDITCVNCVKIKILVNILNAMADATFEESKFCQRADSQCSKFFLIFNVENTLFKSAKKRFKFIEIFFLSFSTSMWSKSKNGKSLFFHPSLN